MDDRRNPSEARVRGKEEVPLVEGGTISYYCFKDLCLKVKARVWPSLSYMCYNRSAAESVSSWTDEMPTLDMCFTYPT
jgi:hypothetical protein